MPYEPEYTKRFLRDLKRYASLRKQVKKQHGSTLPTTVALVGASELRAVFMIRQRDRFVKHVSLGITHIFFGG